MNSWQNLIWGTHNAEAFWKFQIWKKINWKHISALHYICSQFYSCWPLAPTMVTWSQNKSSTKTEDYLLLPCRNKDLMFDIYCYRMIKRELTLKSGERQSMQCQYLKLFSSKRVSKMQIQCHLRKLTVPLSICCWN